MKILHLLCVMFICMCAAACDTSNLGTSGNFVLDETRPAPEITVSSLDGESLRISELKGKVTLLNFWATWCPPCREEIPSMMQLNSLMKDKPFQIVAVSLDEGGKATLEAFFRSSGYSLPTYLDADAKAVAAYGVRSLPTTFVINKDGIIVKRILGPVDWNVPEMLTMIDSLVK